MTDFQVLTRAEVKPKELLKGSVGDPIHSLMNKKRIGWRPSIKTATHLTNSLNTTRHYFCAKVC
jgi:hypothetical protein